MANPLLKEKNDLDFGSLEPGDLLLVANPTDPRDPRGDYVQLQRWGTVQSAPIKVYAANHDILALRVKCSPEVRRGAVEYAQGKIGFPYSPNIPKILFNRRDTDHYSCGSLAWQALETLVLPAMLLRNPHIEIVAYGTRYEPIKRGWRHLGHLLERLWFRCISRANIII